MGIRRASLPGGEPVHEAYARGKNELFDVDDRCGCGAVRGLCQCDVVRDESGFDAHPLSRANCADGGVEKENRILKGRTSDAMLGEADPHTLRRYATYPERGWFVGAFDEAALAACYASVSPISGTGLIDGAGTDKAHIALSVVIPALAPGNAAYLAFARRIDDDIAFHRQWDPARSGVAELHWSGELGLLGASGTARLVALLRQRFTFARDARWSVSLDWRAAHDETLLDTLILSGFAHLELRGGAAPMQRLDGIGGGMRSSALSPNVGEQGPMDAEQWRLPELVALARTHGFASVGAVLEYGAGPCGPRGIAPGAPQSPGTLQTLDALIAARATRIRLQTRCTRADVLAERVALVERLHACGYVQLGIDDYAQRDDPLVSAQRFGRLVCKPFGLSSRATQCVVPLGPGAIGATADAYFQHLEEVPSVPVRSIAGRKVYAPGLRGWRLSADDAIRRTVIQSLATNFFIDRQAIELAHNIEFSDYFANEIRVLCRCANAGLLSLEDNFIETTEAGRLRLGNLCGIFDRYQHLHHTWLRSLAGTARTLEPLLAVR
ncbi:hypothetical protein SAMN04487769_1230 [Burkholderia sp. b14]|nr:hypothetical protein SAMN04487769_1230 [Burkholderia sp. b14]